MATPEETSRLRTLADAVGEPGLSTTFGSGTRPVRFSNAGGIRGGFDVNKVSEEEEEEEEEEEGSVVAEPRMMVGPDGLGLIEKVGDVGPKNGCGEGEGEFKGSGVALGCLYGKIGETNGTIEDLNVVDNGGNIMMDMDGERGGGYDAESIERHGYSAGDLVWGKIKSHPWWPGQIYDPKNASDYALKFNQTGRLLVAYFGDRSFAWCLPSQLIPFAEHFDGMSKQSSSKSFVNAVQQAADEIGRLVEIEMTCKCVPEENRKGLDGPLAANAGIKAGVLVPEGVIGKLLSFRYDSTELLATVQNIATSVSFASALEFAILKSWLSAFYRARGGYLLSVYHGGLQIEGLDRNGVTYRNVLSVPIEVPVQGPLEENWSLALAGPGNGPAPSDDQIYYRRKQKSVAEIMAEVTDRKSKSRKSSVTPEGTNATNFAKHKSKVDDEAGNQGGSIQGFGTVRKTGRKKINEIPNAEIGHVQPEEEIHKKSFSTKLNEDKVETADGEDDEGTKGTEQISSPRERKKSKYLSPPYTSSRFRSRNPILKKVSQKESEKISKIARMGECMTKAAGILLESPPVVNCNGQSPEKKMPEDGQLDASADLIPPKGKQSQQKVIDSMNVNAPVKQVLAEVVSIAINPLHSWDERFLDLIRGFIFAFRSSVFNQPNHALKRLPGRKRKSLSSEQEAPEAKSPRTVESVQDKRDKPKPKKTAIDSGVKSNDTRCDRKASPASLVVTFAPGFSLPSKDDIIRTFSKFGVLNEKETVVLPESASVQIVYSSPSGAEEALRASLRQSPFGSSSVNYKLCYSSAAPVVESSHNTSSPYVRTFEKPVAPRSAADEKSQLGSIRQKLEIMTSMLGKCDGKISTEEVSKLDGEINPLFKKVRKMAEAAAH